MVVRVRSLGLAGSGQRVRQPQADSGSSIQGTEEPRVGGRRPWATRCGSWGSRPCLVKLPRVPCRRKRGAGSAASMVAWSSTRSCWWSVLRCWWAVVVEGDVGGVFDVGLVAIAADGGGEALGWAEEREALVEEVRAEVLEE